MGKGDHAQTVCGSVYCRRGRGCPRVAHHAFAAEFDAKQPVKIREAVVTEVEWTEPALVDSR
jgi:hypothetical protein